MNYICHPFGMFFVTLDVLWLRTVMNAPHGLARKMREMMKEIPYNGVERRSGRDRRTTILCFIPFIFSAISGGTIDLVIVIEKTRLIISNKAWDMNYDSK